MKKPKVTITGCSKRAVKHTAAISGKVTPGNSEVQVLVFSHDGRWYKQKKADVKGSHWSADACFGFEDSVGTYLVVAVTGLHIAPSRIEDIPTEAACSKVLEVERT